jgi:L-arabinokinase
MKEIFHKYFSENQNPVFVASAPGRLDVIGGIADYSGSLVLQMPITQQTHIAIALRTDGIINIHTLDSNVTPSDFTVEWQNLLKEKSFVDYDFAHEQFNKMPGGHWAGYVAGCLLVLHKEKNISITGADILVDSQVPVGKGVSSSAALEVATLKALSQAYQLQFFGTDLPVLAQKVENYIVKAPCGLMDQLASYFGKYGQLLPILCQPDILFPLADIPENLHFIGIDSGVRHSVGGSSYGDVRTAAFMGYTIIAHLVGCDARLLSECRDSGNLRRLPFQGYLANISIHEFEGKYLLQLPEKLSGKDFLKYYGVSIDTVTQVNPDTVYNVRQATLHPVYEHQRVRKFMVYLQELEKKPNHLAVLTALGNLMYDTHESYTRCGLGSEKTDELIEMAKVRLNQGVYGAKITGGGSGGTVCIMCYGDEGLDTTLKLYEEYCEKAGRQLTIFR